MSQSGASIEQSSALAFFTPQAFDNARVDGITKFEPNTAAITRIGEITGNVSPDFALPDAAESLAIVIRGGRRVLVPHGWDGRFREAGSTQDYVPVSALEITDPMRFTLLSKLEIQRLGRWFLELTISDFKEDMGAAMAASILGAFNHPNPTWSAVVTMLDTGYSLSTNMRKTRAVAQVRKEGLKPFVINRRPPGMTIVRKLGR